MSRFSIARIGIVVPAHNEADLLPGCLAALAAATDELRAVAPHIEVNTVVVLDRCTDGSAAAVRAAGVRAVSCVAGSVGRARRIGVECVTDSAVPARHAWLASTDADSQVPRGWLVEQLRFAESGAHAVVGTVRVDGGDWSQHARHVPLLWSAAYMTGDDHPHVHGANLGVRASALAAVGGFPPLAVGEDAAVVHALAMRFGAARVVRTGAIPVLTSARRDARCAGGFGDFLSELGGDAAAS